MKKQAFLVLAVALSIAACSPSGGNESSSSSSGESTSSSSPSSSPSSSSSQSGGNVFVEDGWPEKEAETMASIFLEHLYPYYDFGTLGYTYELNTYQESYMMTSVHIEIADFPFEQVKNYLAAMTNGTGYEDRSSHYSVVDGFYIIEKTFSDYSLISASFSICDEEENILTEGNGTFELDIHPGRIAKEAWLGGDIEKCIADVFETEITLPTPTNPASKYIAAAYLRDGKPVPVLSFVGLDAVDSYSSDLLAEGWKKVPLEGSDIVIEDSYYLISPDEKISATIYVSNPSNPIVTVLDFQKAEYFISYPADIVNDCLDVLYLTSQHISLPVPEAQGVTYYYVNDHAQDNSFFTILLHGVDYVEAYEAQLKAASFHVVDYDVQGEQYMYADESETIVVFVFYSYDGGYTNITINKNRNYHVDWPKEDADKFIGILGGETMLPVDEEATYTYISDTPTEDSYFAVYTKNFDDNMNLVDTTSRYTALLNDPSSGWTFDESEDRWHDEKSKLSVALYFRENSGLEIYVEPYVASSKELSESELLAAFSSIGVTDYSFVTVDGTTGYSLISGSGNSFSIIAWRVDQDLLDAYQEKLLAQNHSTKYVNGARYYWDSEKKAGFVMDYDANYDVLTLVFHSYSFLFNYSGSNLSSFVAQVQQEFDPGFTLPSLPAGENAQGLISLNQGSAYITLTISIFEVGFYDELGNALENDGWTKHTGSSSFDYLKSGSTLNWTIRIVEESDEQYTNIAITGREPN